MLIVIDLVNDDEDVVITVENDDKVDEERLKEATKREVAKRAPVPSLSIVETS
jgi:hypothetical protein